jgi:hypothetical protein
MYLLLIHACIFDIHFIIIAYLIDLKRIYKGTILLPSPLLPSCQSFFSSFYLPPFAFLMAKCFITFSPFLGLIFFTLLSHPCFISVFLARMVSSLAYPNIVRTKRLSYCCIRGDNFGYF